jgi:hypothetical protein
MDPLDTSATEPTPRTTARGGWRAREAAEDLYPPWWPRRRAPRRALGAHPGDVDVRAADRVYLGLSLLASTFQFTDEQLARDVRSVALAAVVEAAGVLTAGAARAWQHADDLCPPWPPAAGADPAPSLPGRAGHLLDVLVLLHAYSLAARLHDAAARGAATTAIGAALRDQVVEVARIFA